MAVALIISGLACVGLAVVVADVTHINTWLPEDPSWFDLAGYVSSIILLVAGFATYLAGMWQLAQR